MNDESHVDPELLPLLSFFPPLELTLDKLPELRAMAAGRDADAADLSDDVEVRSLRIPGPRGAPEVGVSVYVPARKDRPLPCALHMHAGGYLFGSAAQMRPIHTRLAVAAECVIVSVDYRLAPETRFPGAIEDCYAALSWLCREAASLGVDADRIGVMGESAGGGLAAGLALLARDRGEHRLAFQHLMYPMLDDRTCTRATSRHAGEFFWTPANNAFGWSALLGVAPGSPDVSRYAAPARAADLSRLPPAFISTGALDLFLDEDLEYARRLIGQGVPVELHVYPGAFHAFDLSPDARVAQEARNQSWMALRRALGVG